MLIRGALRARATWNLRPGSQFASPMSEVSTGPTHVLPCLCVLRPPAWLVQACSRRGEDHAASYCSLLPARLAAHEESKCGVRRCDGPIIWLSMAPPWLRALLHSETGEGLFWDMPGPAGACGALDLSMTGSGFGWHVRTSQRHTPASAYELCPLLLLVHTRCPWYVHGPDGQP